MCKKIPKIHNHPQKTAELIKHYPDGEIMSKIPRVNGKKHGMGRQWYINGMKSSKQMWANGKRHGLRKAWQDDGNHDSETMFRKGKTYGLKIEWWPRGAKYLETIWRNNKHHGVQTLRHENGLTWRERYYVHGKEYARIEWDEKGDMVEVRFPSHPSPHNPTNAKLKNHINTPAR